MLYFIGWAMFLLFFKIYLKFKVVGRRNIPPKGAFIFASNHVSYLDPILLGTSLHRGLYYMARENLFKKRCFGWVMRNLHSFPVRRNEGDFGAVKKAISILKDGKPLVMFPEGTRSKDRNLRPAMPGIGLIALKTKAPVIPVYIEGSFDALPRRVSTLKRHPVRVYIGEPINFYEGNFDRIDKETYQKISDIVMEKIAALKERYAGSIG